MKKSIICESCYQSTSYDILCDTCGTIVGGEGAISYIKVPGYLTLQMYDAEYHFCDLECLTIFTKNQI